MLAGRSVAVAGRAVPEAAGAVCGASTKVFVACCHTYYLIKRDLKKLVPITLIDIISSIGNCGKNILKENSSNYQNRMDVLLTPKNNV